MSRCFGTKVTGTFLVDLLTSSAILGIKKALLSVRVYSQP